MDKLIYGIFVGAVDAYLFIVGLTGTLVLLFWACGVYRHG